MAGADESLGLFPIFHHRNENRLRPDVQDLLDQDRVPGGQSDDRLHRISGHRLELIDLALPELELDVHCSKGTYVRTLAEDLGAELGCGGHVIGLRRTGVGPYVEPERRFVTLDEVEELIAAHEDPLPVLDSLLLPLESALEHWPAVRLTADAAFYLRQGQAVLVPQVPTAGLVLPGRTRPGHAISKGTREPPS